MIIQMAALALAAATGVATTATSPAPPDTTVPVTTLPTQPTTTTSTTTTTTTTMPTGPTTTIPIPDGYTALIDDTHLIVIAVPDAWTDINTTQFIPAEGTEADARPSIVASPDIEKFMTTFDVPGVSYFAIPFVLNPLDVVGQYGLTAGCTTIEVKEYDDPAFAGYVQVGTDCGPQHMTWNMVVANPIGKNDFSVVMEVQTADPTELETILRTFNRT
jgi:hypothetical protein